MARFGDINSQFFDNSGDVLSGGKIYFYESGTTTLKTTYADAGYTIPNTNPVVLSASGRQPNVFFDGIAKAILTDSAGVQIAVLDPVGLTSGRFGDPWLATQVYSTYDVVVGSDGVYYRSLVAANQNHDPVSTTGYWTLLYSVEWNAGITYKAGAVVTYDGNQYSSLQDSNLGNIPDVSGSYWVLYSLTWLSTVTYALDQNVVGSDGILYTSLQASNLNHEPSASPSWWVGTSAAAAASASAAAASASAAATSESNAATSESNAASSASAASTSASNAATSESNAASSASAASTSASNAATSATNAAASEAAAEAAWDQFDDTYLGQKASDPSVDNDGNALATGALYFNTTSDVMRVYNGSAWQDAAAIEPTITLSQVSDVTATAAEVNILDGVTATTAELNYLDITTLGTSEASKVVTADANGVVTFDNGITEEYTAVTSTSNATTCNMQDGTNFSHTLTENTTFTFSNPASTGKVSAFTLKIVQDASASGYTVTWPGAVDWPSATAPTLTATASAVDYFVFITHDGGTTWYGFTAGQALA